jgi:hypothetical protein
MTRILSTFTPPFLVRADRPPFFNLFTDCSLVLVEANPSRTQRYGFGNETVSVRGHRFVISFSSRIGAELRADHADKGLPGVQTEDGHRDGDRQLEIVAGCGKERRAVTLHSSSVDSGS